MKFSYHRAAGRLRIPLEPDDKNGYLALDVVLWHNEEVLNIGLRKTTSGKFDPSDDVFDDFTDLDQLNIGILKKGILKGVFEVMKYYE